MELAPKYLLPTPARESSASPLRNSSAVLGSGVGSTVTLPPDVQSVLSPAQTSPGKVSVMGPPSTVKVNVCPNVAPFNSVNVNPKNVLSPTPGGTFPSSAEQGIDTRSSIKVQENAGGFAGTPVGNGGTEAKNNVTVLLVVPPV
jgi:hypothetical protein